ncbi:MAG: hypothetical protein AAF214_04100 [Pseudomonadota bacterium]
MGHELLPMGLWQLFDLRSGAFHRFLCRRDKHRLCFFRVGQLFGFDGRVHLVDKCCQFSDSRLAQLFGILCDAGRGDQIAFFFEHVQNVVVQLLLKLEPFHAAQPVRFGLFHNLDAQITLPDHDVLADFLGWGAGTLCPLLGFGLLLLGAVFLGQNDLGVLFQNGDDVIVLALEHNDSVRNLALHL